MLDIIRARSRSLGTKIIFGIIILVFIFWGVGNFGAGSSHTAAVVNGEAITLNEYYTALTRQLEQSPDLAKLVRSNETLGTQFKNEILNNMVMYRAVQQEARRMGLFITPSELFQVIAPMTIFHNSKGQFDKEIYAKELAARKINAAEFEEEQKAQMLIEKLRMYISGSVTVSEAELDNYFDYAFENRKASYLLFPSANFTGKAAPSDEEVTTYYTQNIATYKLPLRANFEFIKLSPRDLIKNYAVTDKEASAFYDDNKQSYVEPQKYKLSQITFSAAGPEGTDDEAINKKNTEIKKLLLSLKKEFESGKTFDDLTKEHAEALAEARSVGPMAWLAAGHMVPALEKSVANLKPGQMSDVIRLEADYALVVLDKKEEQLQRSLEQVKAEVKEHLAERMALDDFSNIQSKAEEALREGLAFADIAKEFKVEVKVSGFLPIAEAVAGVGLSPDAIESLQYVPAGKAAPAPIEVQDGIVLVFVKETKPEETQPLDKVKNEIVAELTDQKAAGLAKEEAVTVLGQIKKEGKLPETYAKQLQTTKAFGRFMTSIAPLGNSPQFVFDVFATGKGEWLPTAYDVDNGAIIATVNEVVPPAAGLRDEAKSLNTTALLGRKTDDALTAFTTDLMNRAAIEVFPQALATIPLR